MGGGGPKQKPERPGEKGPDRLCLEKRGHALADQRPAMNREMIPPEPGQTFIKAIGRKYRHQQPFPDIPAETIADKFPNFHHRRAVGVIPILFSEPGKFCVIANALCHGRARGGRKSGPGIEGRKQIPGIPGRGFARPETVAKSDSGDCLP